MLEHWVICQPTLLKVLQFVSAKRGTSIRIMNILNGCKEASNNCMTFECAFHLSFVLSFSSTLWLIFRVWSVLFFFSFVKYYLNCSLNCNLRTNAINIQTKGEKFWNSYSTWKLAYTSYYNIERTFFANALRGETSFDFC